MARTLLATFTAQTSGNVYFSADINLSAAQATGDYFMNLGNSTTGTFYDRVYAKIEAGSGYVLGLLTSGSTLNDCWLRFGSYLIFGTTYHIVADYNFVPDVSAADDTSHLWVDPSDPMLRRLYRLGLRDRRDRHEFRGCHQHLVDQPASRLVHAWRPRLLHRQYRCLRSFLNPPR